MKSHGKYVCLSIGHPSRMKPKVHSRRGAMNVLHFLVHPERWTHVPGKFRARPVSHPPAYVFFLGCLEKIRRSRLCARVGYLEEPIQCAARALSSLAVFCGYADAVRNSGHPMVALESVPWL